MLGPSMSHEQQAVGKGGRMFQADGAAGVKTEVGNLVEHPDSYK